MFDPSHKYSVEVLINGRVLEEYPDRYKDIFVEGRVGTSYSLRIRNNTWNRVLAVPSVDGLSVLSGKRASLLQSNGYVLSSYQTVDIPGWTLDNKSVASFVFSEPANSYAARTQESKELGVIGVAFFEEYVIPTYEAFGSITRDVGITKGSYSLTSAGLNNAGLGTEFGHRQDFSTSKTEFKKRNQNYPDAIITIHYDNERGLAKRGINIREHKIERKSNPFIETGCTPPKGWIG